MAVYSKGKRAKNQQKTKRNKIIILGILACIIIIAIIYLIVTDSPFGNEPDGQLVEENTTQNNEQNENNVVEEKKDEIVSDVTIPEKKRRIQSFR